MADAIKDKIAEIEAEVRDHSRTPVQLAAVQCIVLTSLDNADGQDSEEQGHIRSFRFT